jgi:hypothetical protein
VKAGGVFAVDVDGLPSGVRAQACDFQSQHVNVTFHNTISQTLWRVFHIHLESALIVELRNVSCSKFQNFLASDVTNWLTRTSNLATPWASSRRPVPPPAPPALPSTLDLRRHGVVQFVNAVLSNNLGARGLNSLIRRTFHNSNVILVSSDSRQPVVVDLLDICRVLNVKPPFDVNEIVSLRVDALNITGLSNWTSFHAFDALDTAVLRLLEAAADGVRVDVSLAFTLNVTMNDGNFRSSAGQFMISLDSPTVDSRAFVDIEADRFEVAMHSAAGVNCALNAVRKCEVDVLYLNASIVDWNIAMHNGALSEIAKIMRSGSVVFCAMVITLLIVTL